MTWLAFVPAVVVAGLDVLCDRDDFAEESAAIIGRAKQPCDFVPELRVILEEQGVGPGVIGHEGMRLRASRCRCGGKS